MLKTAWGKNGIRNIAVPKLGTNTLEYKILGKNNSCFLGILGAAQKWRSYYIPTSYE
jgi:hypothetical protein